MSIDVDVPWDLRRPEVDPAPADHGTRWSAFSYRLPPQTPVARTALWRELQRQGALKLGRSAWAVRLHDADELPLGQALAIARDAGGEATCTEYDPSDERLSSLQRQVSDACEHLWDRFFNDGDRLHVRLMESPHTEPEQLEELEELRRQYVETLSREIVATDSGPRARRRLEAIERTIAGEPIPIETAEVGRVTAPATEWSYRDGSRRLLLRVHPWPTLAVESAFNAFEAAIYKPSPTRVPLSQGCFDCTVSADDDLIEAANRRLSTFAASLPD